MEIIQPIYKPLGLTPLEAINRLKTDSPELAGLPMTYAGRLDPMAEGVILVLGGEAIQRKADFLSLPKTYEAEILLGFSSDTFDALGISSNYRAPHLVEDQIPELLQRLLGPHTYPYPLYSSKPVQGKPLWQWVREGRVKGLKVPTTIMDVYSASLVQAQTLPWQEIYRYLTAAIPKVHGDFRQPEILERWAEINDTVTPQEPMTLLKIDFIVASGTYIRTLANAIGQLLGSGALLLKLRRTQIGPYLAKPPQA